MVPSAGNEAISDVRQHAIESADAIGPTGGMKCTANHWHVGELGGKSAPEHFVPRSDSDDGVGLLTAESTDESRQYSKVEFGTQQTALERHFTSDHIAELTCFFQAKHLWLNQRFVQLANEIHQQRFGAADGKASDNETYV